METSHIQRSAETDLLVSEWQAKSAQHQVTKRAVIYLAIQAITLEAVLATLKISRATWYRRLDGLREWEAEGQLAAAGSV